MESCQKTCNGAKGIFWTLGCQPVIDKTEMSWMEKGTIQKKSKRHDIAQNPDGSKRLTAPLTMAIQKISVSGITPDRTAKIDESETEDRRNPTVSVHPMGLTRERRLQ